MEKYGASQKYPFVRWITLILLGLRYSARASPCMIQNGSSIFLTIPESFKPGPFKTLDMIEGDAGPKGNINLMLTKVNRYFGLDSEKKSLILLREIDREALEAKNPPETVQKLTLVCEYLDSDSWRRIDVPVQIVITDVNDNTPVFRNAPYKTTVSELAPVGSVIFKDIHATDADSTGHMVIYSIMKGPYSDYVKLEDTLSGVLLLDKALDFENEKQRNFSVTVMAKDQGNPPMTATADIQITIEDGDDLNPEFLQTRYTALLPAYAKIGYELKISPEPIKAQDRDHGINKPVLYKVVEGASVFDINKTTGAVTVNGTIDQALYVLTIKATQVDNPGRYSSTTLRITAETPNRRQPKFQHSTYTQKVLENTPVNTTILSVQATDKDPNSHLTYVILPGELEPHFNVTEGGDLYLIRALDYEKETGYRLTVRVTDGALTDQAVVTIVVLNENDHDPEFDRKDYVFDVPLEKKFSGSPLGAVGYRDADDDTVATSLQFLDDQLKTAFVINNTEIIMNADGTDLNRTEYRFFVVAVDSGVPPRRSVVPVTVHFPPTALAASAPVSSQYFVLAIVLGGLAGFLLFVVLCLVCYVGRTKPWSRKSPAGTLRSCPLDDDTRGLTYKQRVPYHDMPPASSSPSSESDISSDDVHAAKVQVLQTDSSAGPSPISAWGTGHVNPLGPAPASPSLIPSDLRLSPKGIILSAGNTTKPNHLLRKTKRLKWEDEEKPRKSTGISKFEFGWQSSDTLSQTQTDTERPEMTVYF